MLSSDMSTVSSISLLPSDAVVTLKVSTSSTSASVTSSVCSVSALLSAALHEVRRASARISTDETALFIFLI